MNLDKTDVIASRNSKARQIVAYLSYALEDVRTLSPTSSYLLEMSIAAINDDLRPRLHPKGKYS